jgi:hypothetical protein
MLTTPGGRPASSVSWPSSREASGACSATWGGVSVRSRMQMLWRQSRQKPAALVNAARGSA